MERDYCNHYQETILKYNKIINMFISSNHQSTIQKSVDYSCFSGLDLVSISCFCARKYHSLVFMFGALITVMTTIASCLGLQCLE